MANYAHFCLQKFHWAPSYFLDLDEYEKAFVIASIQVKQKSDKEQERAVKR